jgi:multiple sugar transport system ATP-binding protein
MAFQNFALFPHMTAFHNIASSLELREPSRTKLSAAVRSVATLLKIENVLEHMPRALSNGQKQRTALARALVGSPSLLLLDDPLRNVDAKLRFEMRLELPALLSRQGTTVVYVTQDYKEAIALGDQIAVMVGGTIAQLGSPADIYNSPATVDIARQFGDPVINLLDAVPENDEMGSYVQISGCRVPLDAAYGAISGRLCVLGIRAEHIHFVDADEAGALPVSVEAVTPLNEKLVALTTTQGNRELLLSQPAGAPWPRNTRTHIAIDPGKVHLFDRKTGNRLKIDASLSGAAR